MLKKFFRKILREITRSKPVRALFPVTYKPSPRDMLLLDLLRSRHLGKRCLILGCGPSLALEDVNKLRFEYTFACNKIYLLFDQTEWRPTFYCCEDSLLLRNNLEDILRLDRTLKIFPSDVYPALRGHKLVRDCYFVPQLPHRPDGPDFPGGFSLDATKGLFWGSTVVYSMLQLAVYMGFRDICLLGVDHSYILPGQKVKNKYICEGEINHFHKDYHKVGEAWHEPRVPMLTQSYACALRECQKQGVGVYNASRRTALDVFPKVDLDVLLHDNG
ncbi:MAG: hypothetical protein LBB66_07195 [Desulfovibrio sp.]|jgi:hypothetical protein|nr:hypothetical protein [Desulfovibrio sp.]